MDKFPQELIFALIFGAVMLVQFLLKHLRRRGPLTETEAEVEVEAEEGPEPDTGAQRPRAAGVPPPVQAVPTLAVPAPPRAGPAPGRRDPRRFSRRSLMGSRRAVQDAIVIAAILGPCRAYRPHDID